MSLEFPGTAQFFYEENGPVYKLKFAHHWLSLILHDKSFNLLYDKTKPSFCPRPKTNSSVDRF